MGQASSGNAAETIGFGILLRAWRQRGRLTQEQLAEQAGIAVRTVRNLECGGVQRPHQETVRLLADALGLTEIARREFQAAAQTPPGIGRSTVEAVSALPGSAAPCQLPPDIADFTGRSEVSARLGQLLAGDGDREPTAVVVVAVAGKPGIGKTALAVRVAHQLRSRGRFPDGQLFVNLRGAEPHPREPGEVLERFLRALGVDAGTIPGDLDERAALFRSRLADRRVLVVLDNAASEAQVRTLLPGTAGSAVLATSRWRLPGLGGVHLVDLDVLQVHEAALLLGAAVGTERLAAEPQAALAIIHHCGQLPLAIRIAGARLAARPHWRLARFADLVADERSRLDALTHGDLEVRASVALSYAALTAEGRRAYRLLALLDAPEFPAWLAAAVVDAPTIRAEAWLERIIDAGLLDAAGSDLPGQTRYRFHDVLRTFARERARDEEAGDGLREALTRALAALLAVAEEADRRLPGQAPGVEHGLARRRPPEPALFQALVADPLAWFDAERLTLVAMTVQGHEWALDELTWDLASSLSGYLETRGWYDDWAQTHRLALASARRAGNARGEAYLLRRLGDLHMDQNRYDDANACFQAALAVSDEFGVDRGRAYATYSLGCLQQMRGRLREASASYAAAWSSFQRIGDRRGEAQALYGAGAVCQEEGLLTSALEHFQAALAAFRDVGEQRGAAHLLRWVGSLYATMGRDDEAEKVLRECLAVTQALGDRLGEAYAVGTLGELYTRHSRFHEASTALDQSLRVFLDLDNSGGQALTLRNLGALRIAQRRITEAREHLEESLRLFRHLRMPLGEARTLVAIGDAHLATGDHRQARRVWERALGLFEELGVPEAAKVRTRLAAGSKARSPH